VTLDLDPAIRLRWSQFDYIVRSGLLAGNLYWLPKTRHVFDHGRTVALFQNHDERIEIRKVIEPKFAGWLPTSSSKSKH